MESMGYISIDNDISIEKQAYINIMANKFLQDANEQFDIWCTKNGYGKAQKSKESLLKEKI